MPYSVREALTGCEEVLAAVLANDFNSRDIYVLMAVKEKVEWPLAPERCCTDKRITAKHALPCSRVG